jgi:hypothetical protein
MAGGENKCLRMERCREERLETGVFGLHKTGMDGYAASELEKQDEEIENE